MPQHQPPEGARVSYSQQYRRCGKPGCTTCSPSDAAGHGPYWYATWTEGGHRRSRYLGKRRPTGAPKATAVARLRVRTLGDFALWRGSQPLPGSPWRLRGAGALLGCLLGAQGCRLERYRLANLIWPDADPVSGGRRLGRALLAVRLLLGEGQPAGAAPYIRTEGNTIVLDPAPGWVPAEDWLDADAFAQAARTALPDTDPEPYRAALALYTGDYLPHAADTEWARPRRTQLASLHQDLLLHLARLRIAAADPAEAELCLRDLLHIDPCHKRAAGELVALLAATGRRAQAAELIEAVADAAEHELGLARPVVIAPLRAVLQRDGRPLKPTKAQQHAGQPAAGTPRAEQSPAMLATTQHPTNLPPPAPDFFGRAGAVREAGALLSEARLLTLSGPGGVGKTSLALHLAAMGLRRYPDGVWLVDLAARSGHDGDDLATVVAAVAEVLGVQQEGSNPPIERVAAALQPRTLLLLLDNCEHLLGGCATLAAHLLGACPGLWILATSRQALRVEGEIAWPVPALTLPPAGTAVPAELLRAGSVQLFAARARAVNPAFALTSNMAADVARICRELDGLPLAIELAAARSRLLSPARIAAGLGDRLRFAAEGISTVLPRQQTLHATLDWSWALLDEPERALLCRLSVFAGGCTLAAVEAVCAGAPIDPAILLDILASLVEGSLINADAYDGRTRYRVLETIRVYAQDGAASRGETADLRARHLAWYLGWTEPVAVALRGPEQAAWMESLRQEHDNLTAALTHARRAGDAAELELAVRIWPFWKINGNLTEGQAWLEGGLGRHPDAAAALRALAVYAVGSLAILRGTLKQALACSTQALALYRDLGDDAGTADTLNNLGIIALYQSDYQSAEPLYRESLALHRRSGDRQGMLRPLGNLGVLTMEQGNYPEARKLQSEALTIAREMGDVENCANILHSIGSTCYEEGAWLEAASYFEQALSLFRELRDEGGMAAALNGLGLATMEQGDYQRAVSLFDGSLLLKQALGDHAGVTTTSINLGLVARMQGDLLSADRILCNALPDLERRRDGRTLAQTLEALATVAEERFQAEAAAIPRVERRQAVRSATLFGAGEALRQSCGAARSPADEASCRRSIANLRSALDPVRFEAAWAAGQALDVAGAVSFARRTSGHTG